MTDYDLFNTFIGFICRYFCCNGSLCELGGGLVLTPIGC